MFTFGDALCGSLGHYVDKSQEHMARRMVWDRRQGFDQFRFGRREGAVGLVTKNNAPSATSTRADPTRGVDIAGIGGERAIKKAARLRQSFTGPTFVEPGQTLKIEIHLELIERAPNAFVSTIKDRNLFRDATFVLEVSAHRPLNEIRTNLQAFLKVGPNTKMNEIVHAHLRELVPKEFDDSWP
jgi:hypothetical protein